MDRLHNIAECKQYIAELLKNSYDLTCTSVTPFGGNTQTIGRSLNPGKVAFFGRVAFNMQALADAALNLPTLADSYLWLSFLGQKTNGVGYRSYAIGNPLESIFPVVQVDDCLFDFLGFLNEQGAANTLNQTISDIRWDAVGIDKAWPYLTFVGYKIQING